MSNALEAASLIMVPSGYEDGTLASVKPNDGTGDFTFSRGSNLSATRINEQGYIEKGYENLLLQSNQFNNTWINARSSDASGQIGYDGSSDAWLFIDDAASGTHLLFNNISHSGVITFSVYAKANTIDWLELRSYLGGDTIGAYFDLANGVLGSPTYRTAIDAKIEAVGTDGWYRCSVTGNTNGTNTYVRIALADSDNGVIYAGTGSGSIYIQDAMLNQGLVAYPYIETTTAPVAGGILEDMPRLDWASGAPSLLLEPSRTNRCTDSEYFEGAAWAIPIGNPTITTNYGISPEGVQNSTRVVFSSANECIYDGIAYTGEEVSTIYVKGTSGETIRFGKGENIFVGALFTLDGTWQRLQFVQSVSGNTLTINTGGGATARDIEIWGAQNELGSYPTSYIPTYGVSQTRLQDSCNVSGLAQSFPFTAYIEIDVFSTSVYNQFQFLQSTSNYVLRLGNTIRVGASALVTTNTLGSNKFALSVDASGNFELFKNGTSLGTGTITQVIDEIKSDAAGYEVKEIILFQNALSDEECIQLTTV